MITRTTTSILALPILSLALIGSGCEQSGPAAPKVTVAASATIPAAFFTKNRPEEAHDLTVVKPASSIGEDVTFIARVGGRDAPFVDGLANITVADPGLEACELMG